MGGSSRIVEDEYKANDGDFGDVLSEQFVYD